MEPPPDHVAYPVIAREPLRLRDGRADPGVRAPGEDNEPVVRYQGESGIVRERVSARGRTFEGEAFLNLAEEEDPFREQEGFDREPDLAVLGEDVC